MPSFTDPPNGGKGQIRPALRLVHPSPPKPAKKPRSRGPTFTQAESARIRAALKNARALFGTWACLADAMRLGSNSVESVARGTKGLRGDIVIRLARALGVPVESLYAAPADAARCPHCGRSGAP